MEIKSIAQLLKQKLDETLRQNNNAPGYIFDPQTVDVVLLTKELNALGIGLFEYRAVDIVYVKKTNNPTPKKWIVAYRKIK